MSDGPGFLQRKLDGARSMAATVGEATGELRGWRRALATSGLVLLTLLMVVLALPLLPFRGLFRRHFEKARRPWLDLEAHARRLWTEGERDAALRLLMDVFRALHADLDGVDLPPYGKITIFAYDDAGGAAYAYAAALGRWELAHEVADAFVARRGESKAGGWLLSKATCLAKLGETGQAKELLLRNLTPGRSSEVSRLLDELRGASAAPLPPPDVQPEPARPRSVIALNPSMRPDTIHRNVERASCQPGAKRWAHHSRGALLIDPHQLVHVPFEKTLRPSSTRDLAPGDVHGSFGVRRRLLDPAQVAASERGQDLEALLSVLGADALCLALSEVVSARIGVWSLTLRTAEGAGHRFFMNPLRAAVLGWRVRRRS